MQVKSTLCTWHPVTPWKEMKDMFVSVPTNRHSLKQSFLPLWDEQFLLFLT